MKSSPNISKICQNNFYLNIDVFKVAEMSHKIFGLLLYENLSPRTIKNRPIWSHWFVANMCQGQKYLYDVLSVNRCLLNDLFINNVIWIMKFFFYYLIICEINFQKNLNKLSIVLRQKPWCSGYGRRFMILRPCVRVSAPFLYWMDIVSHIFVLKL